MWYATKIVTPPSLHMGLGFEGDPGPVFYLQHKLYAFAIEQNCRNICDHFVNIIKKLLHNTENQYRNNYLISFDLIMFHYTLIYNNFIHIQVHTVEVAVSGPATPAIYDPTKDYRQRPV